MSASNDEKLKAGLERLNVLKGKQVKTNGMFTHPEVIAHSGRRDTYADLGDSLHSIKGFTAVINEKGAIDKIQVRLVQNKSPRDYKESYMPVSVLLENFCNTDSSEPLFDIVAKAVTNAVIATGSWGQEQEEFHQPSAPTDGWGAWA